jgi:acyl-CoA synthetase (NDP forming)
MTPEQIINFERLLNPRHIAFVGGADAIVAITEAQRRGFSGKIWPVNPKRSELKGIPCYASLDDLPEAPDAVFLAIPAKHVVAAVQTLEKMGAGGIVCYTAGFKEAGADGVAAEAALKDAVGDMALIGPNCYGVINYLDGSALWPFAHGGDCPGYGAAIITQSGMLSSDITMSRRSLPLSHMISAGNQAVMGIEDFIDALCEKPQVRAIGVHIEGLRDLPRFEQAALKALAAGKPIVALKTGNSAIGASLTVSHTGSMSGTKELYQALFDRLGVISVNSPSQLIETLKYLCVVGAPQGKSLAGFTCSGGGATMLADHSETIGLNFSPFSEMAVRELESLLPDIATVSNPLDYTTPIWGQPELTKPVFECALEHSNADAAILVQDYPAAGLDDTQILYRNDGIAFAQAAAARGIPAAICSTIPENMDAETRALLISKGVAPMQGLAEALDAISSAAKWNTDRQRILADLPMPLVPADMPQTIVQDEAEGKTWLRSIGFPTPDGIVTTAAKAQKNANSIGYPVALKMMSPHLQHKTEAGAVALNIRDNAGLADALDQMQKTVLERAPDAFCDRYLIEKMSPEPLAELVVGVRSDPIFGYAMTLGSGGILVELIGDVETILLPASRAALRAALERVKATTLLKGFREKPVANLETLVETLYQLTDTVLLQGGTISEVEINPLFVYEDHVLAVDVLLSRQISADMELHPIPELSIDPSQKIGAQSGSVLFGGNKILRATSSANRHQNMEEP